MGPTADIELVRTLVGHRLASASGPARGYRVDGLLGQGSQALVLAARADDGSPVAIKVFRPSFVRGFPEQARIVIHKEWTAFARLGERAPSPHVVRLLDLGVLDHGGTRLTWLALDRVDGESLKVRVAEEVARTGHGFAPRRAMRVLGGSTEGLRVLHEAGIVHRDVKPSNVLIAGAPPDEQPRITDLGISRPVGLGPTFAATDQLGAPGYAAPELAGGAEVGPVADVFSLAALAYFVLTGAPMFEGSAHAALAAKHREVFMPPSVRPSLHPSFAGALVLPGLDAALRHATRKAPDARTSTVMAFWFELGAHIADAVRWENGCARASPGPNAGPRLTMELSLDDDDRWSDA